jgi:hypothetical protein
VIEIILHALLLPFVHFLITLQQNHVVDLLGKPTTDHIPCILPHVAHALERKTSSSVSGKPPEIVSPMKGGGWILAQLLPELRLGNRVGKGLLPHGGKITHADLGILEEDPLGLAADADVTAVTS